MAELAVRAKERISGYSYQVWFIVPAVMLLPHQDPQVEEST